MPGQSLAGEHHVFSLSSVRRRARLSHNLPAGTNQPPRENDAAVDQVPNPVLNS